MVRVQSRRGGVFGGVMGLVLGGIGLGLLAGSVSAQDIGNRSPQTAPPPGIAAVEPTDLLEHGRKWSPIDHMDKLGLVRKHGSGDRVMVLIPGSGYSGAIFYPTFESYAEVATMYAVSLRGTGGTAPLPGDATQWANGAWTRTSAEGIAELLVAEDLRQVVLVAHGNGAQIAWLVAAEQPERVAGIVALDGYAMHPVPEGTEGGRRGMVERLETRMAGGSDENNDRLRRTVAGASVQNPNDARMIIADHMTTSRPVFRRYMLEAQNNDITEVMMRLAKPALIVAALPDTARGDRIDVMRQRFEEVYAEVPNAFIEYFDQTRHFLMFDNPDLLKTALTEFIASLPAVEPKQPKIEDAADESTP